MAVLNNISSPGGSHVLNYVTLINYDDKKFDVSQIMQKLIIYEDLMSTGYQHGVLTVQDDNGLHLNLPIIGQEWLEVSFQTRKDGGVLGKDEYKKRYKIVAVKDLSKQKDNENQILSMDFVSEAFWLSEQNLFSKSYKSTLTSDIVTDLFVNGLEQQIEVEPTLYPRDWIIPNVTAFDFIYRLTDQSTSKDNLSSDYRFFENITGWNFKSLYTLSLADFSQRLNFNIDNVSDYDRLKADAYRKNTHFDMQEQMLGGLNTTLEELDTLQKKSTRTSIDYSSFRTEFVQMNPEPIYLGTRVDSNDMCYKLVTGNQCYQSNRDSNINQQLKRITQRTLYDASVSTLKIPGNIDLKLGDTVYFDFSFKGIPDQTTSGKYLICKIKHEVTPQEYHMTLNIRKDSNIKGEKVAQE